MKAAVARSYPGRESFWALKLVRLLTKTCAAQEIGPIGFTLVSIVATTEDAAGYRRAVTFWDGQLAPMLGVSPKALSSAREKCVQAGWLYYEHGRKGVPGKYWTTMPSHANGLDQAPSDEGHDKPEEFATPMLGQIDGESASNPPSNGIEMDLNRHRNGIETESQWNRKGCAFTPIPGIQINTNTNTPLPPAEPEPEPQAKQKTAKPKFDPLTVVIPESLSAENFLSAWKLWVKHRNEIKKPLTKTQSETLVSQFERWGPDRAIAAIEYTVAKGWQGLQEPQSTHARASPSQSSNLFDGLNKFAERGSP